MKVVPKKDPAAFVEPNLSGARQARMWSHIDERLHGRRPKALWLAPAFATVALLAAALFLVLRPGAERPAAPQAADVVASGDADQILDFANGSSIALHPHTQLVMLAVTDAKIRVRLERGGVACTVRRGSADDAFTVEAGSATAALGPGSYEVRKDPERAHAVSVEARSGKATVHAADGSVVATVEQGQTWSEAQAVKVAGWVSVAPSAPLVVASAPVPAPSLAKVEPPRPDASQIFARGERARLEGKSDEAAGAFDELYHTFPGDRRAPIAALEAGRLHLHGIGSLKEAVSALTFARANAQEPFREDAHAGLVEGLARAGQIGPCQTARESFLATYPASPHRDKVAARCP